jgi:16S rRNA (guanine527-N7)-methyltransferase
VTRVAIAGDVELHAALTDSQRLGFLGAGRPVAAIVDHACGFVDALTDVSGTVIDLGSGGGVPGLVIARARPDLRLVLVDRRAARADHLLRLVGRLDLADRVEVLALDAATVARDRPGTADAVVARGFGSPAATLRAARPLMRDGALVVVSEPPRAEPVRWPTALLDGLELTAVAQRDRRVAVFAQRPATSAPGAAPSP